MRNPYVVAGLPAAALALLLLPAAGLQAQEPPPGAERPQVETYVVGEARPPVEPGGRLVDMTLDQAIARALGNNIDIQRVQLEPAIQDYSLRMAHAAFAPTLNATYGYTNSTNQSTSQLDGGARITNERQIFNTSMSQVVPWYGGRMAVNFNNSRTRTDNAFSTRNPSYNSSVGMNYTQPLLSGFRIDNQRAALETQRIQGTITSLQVEAQVANITHQVRQAYWALRATIEMIEIQRRNLALARQLLEDNRLRLQLGRLTELQLLQAEAQVANAEQSLLNAEIQWRNQEFAFKRLLLSGVDDPLLGETVNPTDLPALVDREVDLVAATRTALEERLDIRAQRQQRDITMVGLDVSRNNALPDLTLSAGYSLQGVGGNLFDRSGLGGEPELIQPGGYFDGLQSIAGFDTPTWNFALTASYPVGNNASRHAYERARLQLRQNDLTLQSQEIAVMTQVTTAGLAVRNTYLQYEAARRSREAAERNTEAEMLRFNVGVATNFEVVNAQNALTAARLSELQAIINHVNAAAEFERVQRIGG
jgi:outer membrane protein TolC